MNARQICNYLYSVHTSGEREQKDIDAFEDWLYSPLDTRKAEAERTLMRELRGY